MKNFKKLKIWNLGEEIGIDDPNFETLVEMIDEEPRMLFGYLSSLQKKTISDGGRS